MINIWFFLIVGIFVFGFLLDTIIDLLNYSYTTSRQGREQKSAKYFIANFRLSFVSSLLSAIIILGLLLFGGFGKIDVAFANFTDNIYIHACLYFAFLGIIADILFLPFSIFRTFNIEEKFGFNKTTSITFVLDKIKGLMLAVLVGGPLLCFILWLYEKDPSQFWLYAWITVSIFTILISMFYTAVLLPMFNKLVPLEEGELKSEIEALCSRLDFPLTRLYVMDGSKRSTKANAFFSGLGPRKSIVLYDTLITGYTTDEILAVLAHEIGHYKLKHTRKTLIASLFQTAVMFYLLWIVLGKDEIAMALGSSKRTFQLSLTAFAILYTPVSLILSYLMNRLSRNHEYEADAYAKKNFSGEHLASALSKLHKDSLSNPNPHPAYVSLHYSHPTLSQRLVRLKE